MGKTSINWSLFGRWPSRCLGNGFLVLCEEVRGEGLFSLERREALGGPTRERSLIRQSLILDSHVWQQDKARRQWT